jgi:hypothetical protein
MRFVIVVSIVLAVSGCYDQAQLARRQQWNSDQANQFVEIQLDKQKWAARNAALQEGRIKPGMTIDQFVAIWQIHPLGTVSESHFQGHDLYTLIYTDLSKHEYHRDRYENRQEREPGRPLGQGRRGRASNCPGRPAG